MSSVHPGPLFKISQKRNKTNFKWDGHAEGIIYDPHVSMYILFQPGTINQAMQLLLINAVYFKGSWKTPFKEVATAKRDFHGLKSTEKVLMMSHEAPFQTSEFNEPFQGRMLRLPYSNNRLAMYIVLPDEKVTV